MKSKIIFSVILSAMLLTACKSETPLIDELEASGTTASAQAVQVVQEETQSAESEEEKSYILGGETETTVSVTETTAETEPAKKEVTLDVQKIDINEIANGDRNLSRLFFINDVTAIGTYGGNGEICFFDLNDQTVKGRISPPDDWDFAWYYNYIKGSGDILCQIELSRYNNEKNENDYAVLVVYNDFSTELIEGENLAIPVGSHNISDISYDIYDADSGEIIVEGFNDTETDLGFNSKSIDYKFTLDDDRFVYRTAGFEAMPSFGYYDFTVGKAVDFPNSKDFMPIGYYDGKIYAEEACWDGMCQGELYTFDMETLEAEHFMSSPVTVELNDYTEYSMPPGGKYIAANYYDRDNENYENSKNIIFIISPDSGEVLAQYELKTEHLDFQFEFIDDSRFTAFDDYTGEIYIFDVKM